jgi:predicted nucleotide-binding protein (sugar kinase/HSP70/actin superfamily)
MLVKEIISPLSEKINPAYLAFKGSKDKRALRKEMSREIEKFRKMKHDDPAAYPDDWTADMKYKTELKKKGKTLPKSKYTEKFNQIYGEDYVLEESNVDTMLKNKSEKTGIPARFLRQVYNRGLAAWRTGHRPGVSQHQWAAGRVNSFIVGGPARKADVAVWDAYQAWKKK